MGKKGLEPLTLRLSGTYSHQLSYLPPGLGIALARALGGASPLQTSSLSCYSNWNREPLAEGYLAISMADVIY